MSAQYVCVLCVLCTLVVISNAEIRFNLGGSDWVVTNGGNITTKSTVPGDVLNDLLTNGLIQDPYYRYNDVAYRWLSYENWTFVKKFSVPSQVLANDQVFLFFEGLDTVASITINGFSVGNTNNMFREYRFSVLPYLKTSGNVLVVSFTSSATYAQYMYESYPYPVPWSSTPGEIPFRHFIRREQCTFEWDWGPAFVTHGIWRPVYLVGVSGVYLHRATPMVAPIAGGDFLVTARAHVIATKAASGSLGVSVAGTRGQSNFNLPVGDSEISVEVTVPGSSVKLWWPNGKGDHPLYQSDVTWTNSDTTTSVISKNVGFRNVTLVQKPYSDPNNNGTSFYFEVNGIPVFMKGANWIPADVFESRVNASQIDRLLTNALEANMNIIRNWGGGIYQQDEFYDFCDKNGLMVWEEFMFACAMYPRDTDFLNNVREEVRHQVHRLSHHPSIILWAGNNENEGALNWFPESRNNRDLYLVDQIVLYVDTVRATILESDDSDRPFLFSSPTNGPLVEDPYVLRYGDVQDERYGDVHFYNYDFLCTNVSAFPNARFVSEYGWQSLPSIYSWNSVSVPADLGPNTTFMNHRQHHTGGNDQMWNQMLKHFRAPSSQSDPVHYFKNYIYLTQAVQAFCIRAQTEHYRFNRDLKFNTMGALYWQFNDIWQAPTWSSLEYSGRWKMLHYFAKKFFNEVLVSSTSTNTTYTVKIVNDLPIDVEGSLFINVYSYFEGYQVFNQKLGALVKSLGSLTVPFALSQILNGFKPNEAFVLLNFVPNSNLNIASSDNYFFFTPLNTVQLSDPSIAVSNFVQISATKIQFTISSGNPAPLVWMESPHLGFFSDNGFTLPGNSVHKTIVFSSDQNLRAQEFSGTLAVTSLADTYAKQDN